MNKLEAMQLRIDRAMEELARLGQEIEALADEQRRNEAFPFHYEVLPTEAERTLADQLVARVTKAMHG